MFAPDPVFACSFLAAPEEPSTAVGVFCVATHKEVRGVPGRGVQD